MQSRVKTRREIIWYCKLLTNIYFAQIWNSSFALVSYQLVAPPVKAVGHFTGWDTAACSSLKCLSNFQEWDWGKKRSAVLENSGAFFKSFSMYRLWSQGLKYGSAWFSDFLNNKIGMGRRILEVSTGPEVDQRGQSWGERIEESMPIRPLLPPEPRIEPRPPILTCSLLPAKIYEPHCLHYILFSLVHIPYVCYCCPPYWLHL